MNHFHGNLVGGFRHEFYFPFFIWDVIPTPSFFKMVSQPPTSNRFTGGWFGTFFFLYIGNFIIPTDELIFFRGVGLNHPPVSHGIFTSAHQKCHQPCSLCLLRSQPYKLTGCHKAPLRCWLGCAVPRQCYVFYYIIYEYIR